MTVGQTARQLNGQPGQQLCKAAHHLAVIDYLSAVETVEQDGRHPQLLGGI